MMNCVITLSKWLWNHEPQACASAVNFDNVASGSALNLDNVMTKLILLMIKLSQSAREK